MPFETHYDYAATSRGAPNVAELATVPDATELEALERELTSLAGQLNAGNYRFLVLLAEFDRRGGHVGIGLASCAHWLSWRCGISLIAAREKVRVARALENLPKIADAMRRGVVSYCKVRALTRVATPDNEHVLLAVAEAGSVHHVEKLVRTYRRLERANERDADNARYARRYLQSFVDDDGTVVVKARLAPEQGALVLNALHAACTTLQDAERDSRESFPVPDAPVDGPGARRADALALMAEAFMAGDSRPAVGPDRALVTIHVDEPVLVDEVQDGRCELADHTSIPPAAARRVSCDASLVRVTEDATGTPMDVGRKTRAVSTALRRALEARDKACQYPGCTNARFVDAHHIVHWVDGGPTSLDNLVLLCRRHHRFVHEYGYAVEKRETGFEFVRPDGRPVLRVPPPPPQIDPATACVELRNGNEAGHRGEPSVVIDHTAADSRWTGEELDYDMVLRRLFELAEQSRLEVEKEALEARSAATWDDDDDDDEA